MEDKNKIVQNKNKLKSGRQDQLYLNNNLTKKMRIQCDICKKAREEKETEKGNVIKMVYQEIIIQ